MGISAHGEEANGGGGGVRACLGGWEVGGGKG